VPGSMELKPYLAATETVSEETCEVAAIRVRNIVAAHSSWGPSKLPPPWLASEPACSTDSSNMDGSTSTKGWTTMKPDIASSRSARWPNGPKLGVQPVIPKTA
jgi:hypothetical protein